MTQNEQDDLVMAQFARLAVLEPNAARAERHRVRCRRALTRRQLSALRTKRAMAVTARVMEAVLVVTFSAAYLTAVIHDVVRLLEKR
jgi:hypothetical protein